MRPKNKSNSEKLDLIILKLDGIETKVDNQKEEIAELQRQVEMLQEELSVMTAKNRNQALIAGGVGGGLVAVGIEFLRIKFGG